MSVVNYLVFSCSTVLKDQYVRNFYIDHSIKYSKYNSTVIFKNITEILSHFKPSIKVGCSRRMGFSDIIVEFYVSVVLKNSKTITNNFYFGN